MTTDAFIHGLWHDQPLGTDMYKYGEMCTCTCTKINNWSFGQVIPFSFLLKSTYVYTQCMYTFLYVVIIILTGICSVNHPCTHQHVSSVFSFSVIKEQIMLMTNILLDYLYCFTGAYILWNGYVKYESAKYLTKAVNFFLWSGVKSALLVTEMRLTLKSNCTSFTHLCILQGLGSMKPFYGSRESSMLSNNLPPVRLLSG